MPRLTLVPPSPSCPPPCLSQDVHNIVAELRAARDGLTGGPTVLWLVNDLMQNCESLFEAETNASSEATAAARRDFLSRLTSYAEEIRQANGTLSDEFIAFIATAPLDACDHTTN